ncbi:MAG TPA: radical SAM protein [Candidatus Lokiarchaeia archaeon]|nr:radical SAM protein [Candidatus Lokiarchaeia archaeon]
MSYFKNVVLVKAEVEFFDASFFEANIPLCFLAAMIKDHVHSLSMPVDMRIDPRALQHFEIALAKMARDGNACDLVAISTMTASFPNAVKLARIAKKFGAYVVVGGYHPSALPDQMFQVPEIDAVVRGEGEMTFQELVLNGPSINVNGLSFRGEDGEVYHNGDREKITDLDTLPFPYRDVRPSNPIFKKHEVIVTSRGCNGSCTFCANGSVHGRWRGRSAENVVEELKQLYAQNPHLTVHIWDANFMQDGNRVARIIELIKANGIHFKYFCEMRVDHITRDPGLIKGLAEIGMEWIAIGIESPNQERLKRLKKGITTTAVEKAVMILKENNIKIVGYLMIGDPEETVEQMKQYPVYAHQLGINKVLIAIQTPHPGSQFFQEMEANSAITSYDWEKYDIGHSVAKLNHMTNEECEELMDWCWGKFFTPDWAITQFDTLKASIYNYLEYVWFGYPAFMIRARPPDRVEQCLKSYISAMQGYYDLSAYEWVDKDYLKDFKGLSLQVSFKFSDGSMISFLTTVSGKAKPVVEIFAGKRHDASIDFTINSSDFIAVHKALPVQTSSLVHWAGFSLDNYKADWDVLSSFMKVLAKSFQFNSVKWQLLPRFLFMAAKFFPKQVLDLILGELPLRRDEMHGQVMSENSQVSESNSLISSVMRHGRRIVYKTLLLPFAAILQVD